MITREQTRDNYDRLSKWYDLFAGSEKRFTDLGLWMLNVQVGEKILEIGCGTGHALLGLARNTGTPGFVVGMDLSRGMLNVAGKQMSAKFPKKPITLVEGDAVHIPFEEGSFDIIFLSFILELFSESEMNGLLEECARVLKIHGRMGVVSLAKQEKTAVHIYEWFHKQFPVLVECRPIFVQSIVKKAGFTLQQSAFKTMWGLPVEILVAENSL